LLKREIFINITLSGPLIYRPALRGYFQDESRVRSDLENIEQTMRSKQSRKTCNQRLYHSYIRIIAAKKLLFIDNAYNYNAVVMSHYLTLDYSNVYD